MKINLYCDRMVKVKNMNEEKKENKTKINKENFAKFLKDLRKANGLTQQKLADILGVSNRTISKWENDGTIPDYYVIKNICKKFHISPSSIVLENRNYIDYYYSLLSLMNSFLRIIFKNILKIIFVIVFILLLIYFLNNFNAVKFYTLTFDSENITFKNGMFIENKGRNTLFINNINIKDVSLKDKTLKLELYVLVNGDKNVIYENSNLDDIFIQELNSYPKELKKDIINSMKKTLYLNIIVIDKNNDEKEYKCKINLKKDFENNKLTYSTYKVNTTYNYDYQLFLNSNVIDDNNLAYEPIYKNVLTHDYQNSEEDVDSSYATSESTENKLESLGYEYDEQEGLYVKVENGKTITYSDELKYLNISYRLNNESIKIRYYIEKDRIDFGKYNDFIRKINLKYYPSVFLLDCIVGNCNKYLNEIDYILDEYEKILKVL